MSFFNISKNGIDCKYTDPSEKTYSGDGDDSKNKSISLKRGYNCISTDTIIGYKNTKLHPVNRF
jgi:hypothetical protein